MFRSLFGSRPTNGIDALVAAGAALLAVVQAASTYREYKANVANENEENNA